MHRVSCYLIVTIAFLAMTGCAEKKAQTPRDVSVVFRTLMDSLANEPPETAAGQLRTFLDDYGDYQIADSARLRLDDLGEAAGDRYHEARELARAGEFDQAEQILEGIVANFPHTDTADNAARYLEYEFYYGKAQWLLVRQRHKESGEVARALLERDLTPFQTNQVEQILDNVGYVDAAYSQSERFDAKNACRQVAIMLAQQYAMEGEYPSRFSLEDARNWDTYGSGNSLKGLSAIEGYKVSDHRISFVGVSKSGQHRIRVVDGTIQD